jgi:hypothetical protein
MGFARRDCEVFVEQSLPARIRMSTLFSGGSVRLIDLNGSEFEL